MKKVNTTQQLNEIIDYITSNYAPNEMLQEVVTNLFKLQDKYENQEIYEDESSIIEVEI